jgi:hypothetical protein
LLTAKGSELVDYAEKMLQLRADMLGAIGDPASLRGRCSTRAAPMTSLAMTSSGCRVDRCG